MPPIPQQQVQSPQAQPERSGLDKLADAMFNLMYRGVDAVYRPSDPAGAAAYNQQRINELTQGANRIDSGQAFVKDSYPLKYRIQQLQGLQKLRQ